MTLTRWSPLHQLSNIRDEIERMFENPYSPLLEDNQSFFTGWGPALDLHEDKENIFVKAEVPGMKKEEIEISLHDGTLTLSGERRESTPEAGVTPIRTERFAGRFSRSVSLPSSVDADKVKATYRDGILTVVLPKAEDAKPKQIQINGE
ncbi:MAG TPA: Hsp20/alpha crystallin family protein [Candidatus Saccharimonadales bacterium]|nr:Hsp20/alpha crystallin family protein [Candidatus Saccharimonadales bacterium]